MPKYFAVLSLIKLAIRDLYLRTRTLRVTDVTNNK
jgi:hypothetical protein